MFNGVYEWYVKYWGMRFIYQAGFFTAWAIWAQKSLSVGQVTWLVFGWLPAVFWPIELAANLQWLLENYFLFGELLWEDPRLLLENYRLLLIIVGTAVVIIIAVVSVAHEVSGKKKKKGKKDAPPGRLQSA